MGKFEIAPSAMMDLRDSSSHIAKDNKVAAKQWRDQLYKIFHLLADTPRIGRDRSDLQEGLRSFPVGRFVVFYHVQKDNVFIVHVLRGARKIESFF